LFSLKSVEIFQVIRCLIQDFLLVAHFVPGFVGHTDPGIFLQLILISGIKVPIETVKWASTMSGFFGTIVSTGVAVIPLLFDVVG
jgi:hypothetical protein